MGSILGMMAKDHPHPLQCSPADLAAALSNLPPALALLASSPLVSVVTATHPSVPHEIAERIRNSNRESPSSCTMLNDDGSIVVAMSKADSDLVHEMAHVAQVHAPPDAMRRAFDKAADLGDLLRDAAGRPTMDDPSHRPHRDLARAESFADPRNGAGTAKDSFMSTFALHRDMGATDETIALAKTLGIDAQGVVGASFASALRRAGHDAPSSDVARECVAHAFQGRPHDLVELATAALPAAVDARRAPPIQGALSIEEARSFVRAMPGAVGGKVPAWLAHADVDAATTSAGRQRRTPYSNAVADVVPAVVQPTYVRSGATLVPDGGHEHGRRGAVALYEGFGDVSGHRRLWFDAERLAQRIVHLEGRGAGVMRALASGSRQRDLERTTRATARAAARPRERSRAPAREA